jgi:hypothetical protein
LDQSATWTPTHTKSYEETWAGGTFTATSDGDWYFHLATVDNAGNWTGTVHLGPFRIDTTPPSVSCAGDITVAAPFGEAFATVSWEQPAAIDTGSGLQSLVSTHTSGALFPVGDTRVTYTAADVVGNTSRCSFRVDVVTIALSSAPGASGSHGKPGSGEEPTSILDASILLDPEAAPLIGKYPLHAIYAGGDVIHGAFRLLESNGRPLRAVSVVLFFYEVALGDDGSIALTLLDSWVVGFDPKTRDWHFQIQTEGLGLGYYYIYLGFPGETSVTLPIQVAAP